jgi:phytoene synthase
MPASSPEACPTGAGDLAACRALMAGGSRTFSAAARLLPRRVRDPATALYAFCRLADDAIDGAGASADALDGLRRRLDLAYDGRPADHEADRAFSHAVCAHRMPRALPLALLEGFAWDAAGRRYATLDELLDYAARVAGSVGAMMAVLMGARAPQALARACDLGVAMQLTNIARDVGEDARAGRLYLPLAWCAEAGLDPVGFLADPRPSPALAGLVERLLGVAAALYARGRAGIAALPAFYRPGIAAAGLIYADIGRVLARAGHDPVSGRAHVPGRRKVALIGRSLLAALPAPRAAHAPPLAACAFLVEAASRPPPPARVVWVLDLFGRLAEQQWEVS